MQRFDPGGFSPGSKALLATHGLFSEVGGACDQVIAIRQPIRIPTPIAASHQVAHALSICNAGQVTSECLFLARAAVRTIALERQDRPIFADRRGRQQSTNLSHSPTIGKLAAFDGTRHSRSNDGAGSNALGA
jgi:hypothetical protein